MEIYNGDCLELFKKIPNNSIDLVLVDPPYGTTECSWDSIIPLTPMWYEIKRVTKDSGNIIIFGKEPFSSRVRLLALDIFKYDLIWEKSKAQNFAQAPYRSMGNHEIISIFSKNGTSKNAKNRMVYNPQGTVSCNRVAQGKSAKHSEHRKRLTDQKPYIQKKTNYPKTIIKFSNAGRTEHPTQKPIALMEYLVKTFSNVDDRVLDFTMGSGSTGVACLNTNRDFTGFEINKKYFDIAKERLCIL